MKYFYIVNNRLTYISTQLLLEWIGFKANNYLHVSYYKVKEESETFIFDFCDDNSVVFFIGFTEDLNNFLKDRFSKYRLKFIPSDLKDEALYIKLYESNLENIKQLDEHKKNYLELIYNLLNNDYSKKESYIINVLFYNISAEYFYNLLSNGFNKSLLSNHIPLIRDHIKEFNQEDHSIYKIDEFYFINSKVKFIGDFVYKFHNKLPNIGIIDVTTGRVYFKQLSSDSKDVSKLCLKVCEDFRGFRGFCSGKITPIFMELTKKMSTVNI